MSYNRSKSRSTLKPPVDWEEIEGRGKGLSSKSTMNNNLRLNLDLRLGGLRVGSREKLYDREVCLQTGV